MNKYFSFKYKIIFICSLVIAFCFGIILGNFNKDTANGNLFGNESTRDEGYFRYYNMFRETYKILQNEFVDPQKTDAQTLLSGAIKGMLQSTGDPYTDFLSPEIAKEFTVNIQASFYGVGIRLDSRNGLTVVAPIAGTPAAEAGIQPGDQIIEIDGTSTKDMTSLEAVNLIRGKLGTSVSLTLLRPGVLQSFTVTLKRAKIEINTVESAVITNGTDKIGYIKLIEFSEPTAKEFEKALKDLLKQSPTALILDVRNNPGGLLTSVAHITDLILQKGLIVYTRGRTQNENFEYRAAQKNTLLKEDIPVGILINQGSASASEILAGALQDTKRGIIIGKKSFGKGSVQKTRELPDHSILKYTVAKYYTPAGKTIEGVGLEPDIEVDMWFDTLDDREKTAVIQLQVTNLIPEFLKTNNKPNAIDLTNFYNLLTNEGYIIKFDSINSLIRQHQRINSTNIYDLLSDNQLQKAIQAVTKDFSQYKTNIQYFETIVEKDE